MGQSRSLKEIMADIIGKLPMLEEGKAIPREFKELEQEFMEALFRSQGVDPDHVDWRYVGSGCLFPASPGCPPSCAAPQGRYRTIRP